LRRWPRPRASKQLLPFFSQWIDGTGAPTFTNKYSVYRLGNNKGFRTIGEINQDLDLFRMPVDLRIETDGKTVNQKRRSRRHRYAIHRRHLRPPAPHQRRSQ
jgi:aminopeptidase N